MAFLKDSARWESLSKFRQNYEYFVICEYKNTGTYHIFPAEKEWPEERCTKNGNKSCCNRSFKNRELEYFSTLNEKGDRRIMLDFIFKKT